MSDEEHLSHALRRRHLRFGWAALLGFSALGALLEVLHALVEAGNTVLVIEHNLEVIKTADWIIDLGPEGGDCGGDIVATGTPEEVAGVEASHTGRYLRLYLAPQTVPERQRRTG